MTNEDRQTTLENNKMTLESTEAGAFVLNEQGDVVFTASDKSEEDRLDAIDFYLGSLPPVAVAEEDGEATAVVTDDDPPPMADPPAHSETPSEKPAKAKKEKATNEIHPCVAAAEEFQRWFDKRETASGSRCNMDALPEVIGWLRAQAK